jgi:hypothetical protein
MVSIFCSSLPFSKDCLSSFWDGTSAALSWCTCGPQSAPGPPPVLPGIAYKTVRVLEKCRHDGGSAAACRNSNPEPLLSLQKLRLRSCPSVRNASDLQGRWDATCTDRNSGGEL